MYYIFVLFSRHKTNKHL